MPKKHAIVRSTAELSELISLLAEQIADAEDPADKGQRRETHLARLTAISQIMLAADELAASDASAVIADGATIDDLARAWGVTRQVASKRWGKLYRAGDKVVVIISRRSRTYQDPEHPNKSYGEVGGSGQYGADREGWPAGADIRRQARHVIVAVDGLVCRVYEIGGWARSSWARSGATWCFEGRQLSPEEINHLFGAGELPFQLGDACSTRVGGAYRPHWF